MILSEGTGSILKVTFSSRLYRFLVMMGLAGGRKFLKKGLISSDWSLASSSERLFWDMIII